MAFHIFGHTGQGTVALDFGDFNPWLTSIWPAGRMVKWPPKRSLEDAGIGQLHESLQSDMTDEVRAVREGGLNEYIRSLHRPKPPGK